MIRPRVRFAPSPTGYLHIGSLRTALYDYLFARKNGGDFILKIEDTDQKRYVEGAVESLIKSLEWAGLTWDEGVFLEAKPQKSSFRGLASKSSQKYPTVTEVGDYGPYIQSEKLDVYKKYAEQLVKDGYAYYCFCEPERLEEMRKEQQVLKKPPIYDQYCLRNVSPDEVNKKLKENCPYTIRLKVPKDETIEFEDIIRGKVKFDTSIVDDQVLLKSDGFPTYHLANIIDDHDMKITHVIRGEEWLPSIPKHLLIYKYLGWDVPQFAHVPLLLNPDKSKLSKRQGDVAVEDYIKKGYLKEAIMNFVAFLGWNPGEGSTQEIFTLDELVKEFKLERVHKGGAVFDIQKLNWLNSQWIKRIDPDDLYNRAKSFYLEKDFIQNSAPEKKSDEYLKKVLVIERDRLAYLSEVGESNKFFFTDINYDKNLLRWKEMADKELKQSLEKSRKLLDNIQDTDWTRRNLEKTLMEAAGDKKGDLLWPLRMALTGEQKSPSPFEVAWVLGKEETLKRIDNAIKLVK
jgi:glutamyl-tRNA synthetase